MSVFKFFGAALAAGVSLCVIVSSAAQAHTLGQGSFPTDELRPEVVSQVMAMTQKSVEELAAQELKDDKYRPLAAYIEEQVTRLIRAPGNEIFFRDIPAIHVHLLPTKQINAFAMATGDIYVYLGLIPTMKHQNMLTAVLAHELSHVSRAHVPRLLQKYWDRIPHDNPKITLEAWTDVLSGVGKAAQMAALYLELQNDKRGSEREADEVGCELLNNAGISPWYFRFSMNALQRFAEPKKSGDPSIKELLLKKLLVVFSDHPATDDRVSDTERELKLHDYRDYREQAPGGFERKIDQIDPRYSELYQMVKAELASH